MKYLLVMILSVSLGGCFITRSGTSYDIGVPNITGAPIYTSPQNQTTDKMSLAMTERYYQACVSAVGDLLSTNMMTPGSPNARLMGRNIKDARMALDTWHIQPSNTAYALKARQAMRDFAGLVRASGGQCKGSMG